MPWLTWQRLSRATGLTVVITVLSAMLAGARLDEAVTLVLLAIAAGLLGLPAGYALVLQRSGNTPGGGGPPSGGST